MKTGNATIISGNLQYLANLEPISDKTVYSIIALLTQWSVNKPYFKKISRHDQISKPNKK